MRASRVLPAGEWDASRAVDRVLVDFDARHRRRFVLAAASGREVLLDLAQATRLRDGDGLETEAGIVCVCARAEKLLEIHVHGEAMLARIAWHLGNRHLPIQFVGSRIRLRSDHVIEAMVEQLGGHAERIEAPFDPEAGAYAGGHHHHIDDHD